MKTCIRCGAANSEGSVFCGYCGNKFDDVSAAETIANPSYATHIDAAAATVPESTADMTAAAYTSPVVEAAPAVDAAPVAYAAPVVDAAPDAYADPVNNATPDTYAIPDLTAQFNQIPEHAPMMPAARIALSTLFGILLFVFVSIFIALTAVRPANIPRIVEQADISLIAEEAGLDEEIINEINDTISNHIQVDIDSVKDFLRRDTVSAEVAKVAERYAAAFVDGDFDYHMTSREIISFIRSIAPDIRDEFDYRLTNEDYDAISEALREEVDLRDFRVGRLLEDAGVENFAMPFILLSVYPLIIVGILCIIFISDIFLVNRRKVRSALLISGIPLALSGLIFTAAGVFFNSIAGLFGNSEIGNYIGFAGGLANLFLLPGLICFAIGVLCIVAFFVIRTIKKLHQPKSSQKLSPKFWRFAVLIANGCALILCLVFSLVLYLNLPH